MKNKAFKKEIESADVSEDKTHLYKGPVSDIFMRDTAPNPMNFFPSFGDKEKD